MKYIDFKKTDGHATISFAGRLETSVTTPVQEEIIAVLEESPEVKEVTWDGNGLTYISSSGLRLMLFLKKRFPAFQIINVCPEVYSVFEMTGFTKMISIERGLRQVCVDGCEEIGRGGVGVVYCVSDDTIVKVFRPGTSMDDIKKEIDMSKEAFVLGMPTAISFDIVRVGEQYGLVYELLKAQTLSHCIKNHPERIDEYARLYAHLFQQLHSIKVSPLSSIPNGHKNDEKSIDYIRRYFDDEWVDMLLQIHRAIPLGDRLMHCDLQTKNAMVQGDELMLIDMGEVSYGHPLIDLAHAYSAMVGLVGNYEDIIGIPEALGKEVWNKMINYYFAGLDEKTKAHRCEQIRVASYIRNFSWLSLSDSFPEEVVESCRETFVERVKNQWDSIVEISQTFTDWTLE